MAGLVYQSRIQDSEERKTGGLDGRSSGRL